ncbi:hypothetical protein [Haloarcula sp. Atlit-7R]|uniref:hypothetical protein n=1 Tax=Haloarcula sp. Atlit-7R TaxID=2282125 RepID=UPI000EF1668C|nr:hypothetical protein [Haloarcula sp. Atlit-7R]RLM89525.1 hypothetical protein D3D01_19320 [Haloarcula sp. Atlit-7R]
MDQTPGAFHDALSSGDTECVNQAIDEVGDMDLEERAAMFDACFEVCCDLYESDDGYQRQSVIRFAAALYPRLAVRTVGDDITDDALPGEWTRDEIAIQRTRLFGLYLLALVDDDGRVRRAAIKGLKQLAVTLDVIEADDELQMMADEIERIADKHDGSKQKHLDQAYENVAFHAEKPGSLLPDELRDTLAQDLHRGDR